LAASPDHGRRDWRLALPPLATLAATVLGISGASFWRDEAATLSATQRSLPEMVRMLGHVDAVHALYYLMMWPLAHLFGTSELVMRLPSAIAIAVAAFGVALIGRRLGTWQTGLLAGLVFAALPMTSRYGQEARSYALVTAIAVLSSYLAIRLIDEPVRRWLVSYAASLAALGAMNIFALLIIPAHGMTLAAAKRPAQAARATRVWAAAVAAACAAATPMALLTWTERQQLAWLGKPRFSEVMALLTAATGSGAAFVLLVALGVAGTIGGRRRSGEKAESEPAGGRIFWLSAPWLFVPPGLLIAISEIRAVYVNRYVVFCLPALALLTGAGLAALGRYWRIAAFGMIVLLALPMQLTIRQPPGHGDDIRSAAQIVQAKARPTDAVVYRKPGSRELGAAYPYGVTRLRDIGLAESAVAVGNLSGTDVARSQLDQRLRVAKRVWFVEVGDDDLYPRLVGPPRFKLIRRWSVGGIALLLYRH